MEIIWYKNTLTKRNFIFHSAQHNDIFFSLLYILQLLKPEFFYAVDESIIKCFCASTFIPVL